MNEFQPEDLSTTQTDSQSKFKQQLTTVTPLSKYLAMIIFIAMPFVGFYIGSQYAKNTTVTNITSLEQTSESIPTNETDTNNEVITKNQNPTEPLTITADSILLDISKDYGFIFSKPKDRIFTWETRHNKESGVEALVIEGREIHVFEEFLQYSGDTKVDYIPLAFQIDNELTQYLSKIGFDKKSFYFDSEEDMEDLSIIGFENDEAGLVCIRTIQDATQEKLSYSIACGET